MPFKIKKNHEYFNEYFIGFCFVPDFKKYFEVQL